MKFLYKFLSTYAYHSLRDFFESMFPTWKYHLQTLAFVLSAISGILSYYFGFGPTLGFAMLIAIILEVYTGISASRKQGGGFESFRFSRCVLKLSLWAGIFFVIHQFENEYINRSHAFDILTYLFFKLIFLGAMSLFLIEHLTSILENKAVIEGKPKTYFIDFIQETWKGLLNAIKNLIK